jgi:glycosyltransferase involved in cell wall biosynthesis
MISKPTISIIICTHNRADLAHDAIASVLAQDFPLSDYELIIVDNASIDNTHEMVVEFCQAYPNVHYLYEKEIGLSHARNQAWQNTNGDYIGYLDDDCNVPPEWLKVAFQIMENMNPAAFGGPSLASFNSPKPAWFRDEYGSHVQSAIARPLKNDEYLDGMNLFIRRDLLSKLCGFNPSFGMKGKKIAYGEETELLHRIRVMIPDSIIYYDPALFVYHLVRPEKMKLMTILNMSFKGGRDYARIVSMDHHPRILSLGYQMIVPLLKIGKSIIWDMHLRDHLKFPYYQNFLVEVSFRHVTDLGFILGQIIEQNGGSG